MTRLDGQAFNVYDALYGDPSSDAYDPLASVTAFSNYLETRARRGFAAVRRDNVTVPPSEYVAYAQDLQLRAHASTLYRTVQSDDRYIASSDQPSLRQLYRPLYPSNVKAQDVRVSDLLALAKREVVSTSKQSEAMSVIERIGDLANRDRVLFGLEPIPDRVENTKSLLLAADRIARMEAAAAADPLFGVPDYGASPYGAQTYGMQDYGVGGSGPLDVASAIGLGPDVGEGGDGSMISAA